MFASRTDPLSFEAPYLNYSSEAEKIMERYSQKVQDLVTSVG